MRMGIKESGVLLVLSIGALIAFALRPEIKRDIVTEQYKAELPQQEEPALIVGTLPEEPVAPAPVVEETKVQEPVAEEIKTDPAASYEPRRVTGNGDLLELEGLGSQVSPPATVLHCQLQPSVEIGWSRYLPVPIAQEPETAWIFKE